MLHYNLSWCITLPRCWIKIEKTLPVQRTTFSCTFLPTFLPINILKDTSYEYMNAYLKWSQECLAVSIWFRFIFKSNITKEGISHELLKDGPSFLYFSSPNSRFLHLSTYIHPLFMKNYLYQRFIYTHFFLKISTKINKNQNEYIFLVSVFDERFVFVIYNLFLEVSSISFGQLFHEYAQRGPYLFHWLLSLHFKHRL